MDPQEIVDAWCAGWVPPDRSMVHQWAMRDLILEGDYARRGQFTLDGSHHLELPFELVSNLETRMMNLLASPQSAKSLIADVFFQYVFKNAPGPFMATFQSDDDAEQHYLTRVEKTFKATPANADMFARLQRKRDLFRWPHMTAYFQGANQNSLQRKSVRYEWNDEVWTWRTGMLGEAWARTEAFRRVCKILNISQGGTMGSDWERTCTNARRYDWGVRCMQCGHLQVLDFFGYVRGTEALPRDQRVRAGIVWDKSARMPDGRWSISRACETTRYKCCECGHEHENAPDVWDAFDRHGAYVCLDPDRSMKDCTVHWNGLVMGDWERLTKKFLLASEARDNGATGPLETFYQKDLARFWDASLSQEKVELTTAGYLLESPLADGYRFELPAWMVLIVITADYQQGRGNDTRHLIVTVRGWGHQRSRLLWEGRINTFGELHKLQLAMRVKPACVCIDGSFEMMEVAAQCAKYGWTMLIGDDPKYFLHKRQGKQPLRLPYSERFRTDPLKGKTGQGRTFCWTFRWSNPSIKNLLWNLRHGLTRQRWEVADNVSPDYRKGIDSEVKKPEAHKKSGEIQYIWVKLHEENHFWDDECMQVVVALISGLLTFDVEEEQHETKPQRAKAEAPVAPHDQPQQLELLAS